MRKRLRLYRIVAAAVLALVALTVPRAFASAAPCFPNLIFKTDTTDTNLYSVNEHTLVQTLVGQLSFASAAAATSLQNGRVYYISAETNNAVQLGAFDPATGTNMTPITMKGFNAADVANGVTFVRAGFNAAGNLYVQSNGSTTLYEVNPATGVATVVGNLTGISASAGDLAFDPTNANDFYLVANDSGANNVAELYSVQLSTLTATPIGLLGITGADASTIYGIAFGNDGKLYVIATAGTLYTINTSTGAATNTGVTLAGTANDLASLPETVNLDAGVAKVHSGPLLPGQPITYTVTLSNVNSTNSCSVTALTLQDVVPASLTNPTFTASTGTYNSTTGNWTGLSIGPGQSASITVTATVSSTASGTITNTASFTLPDGINNTASTNSASDSATVNRNVALTVAKNGTANAAPNGPIAYSLVVSNAGPNPGNGTVLSDPLPSGVTLVGTPACTASGGAACSAISTVNNTITSTIATLPVNGTVTITFDATAAAAATYTNTATVAPPANFTDPNTATASATTIVATSNGVVKTVQNVTQNTAATQTSDTGKPGDTLKYVLTYTNQTGGTLTNFAFNDGVPANTAYVANSAACTTPATCTITPTTGGAVTTALKWAIPSLASGATFTVTFSVTIK